MKKIVIAGGTGFLGTCLTRHFYNKGYQVIVLSRKKHSDRQQVSFKQWDGKTLGDWEVALEGAEALINLTGKSVDCRYHERNRRLIYSSRLDATSVLGKAVSRCQAPPKVWINASSATIYRHAVDRPMDEKTGEIGTGFSVAVCERWEETFEKQIVPNTRKVILRISIVLGYHDGAMQPLRNLARSGFGGAQGLGNQYFSWVHEKDFIGIVDFAIQNTHMEGVYNVATPHPLPNEAFMKSLRQSLRMPFGFPLPAWLLKIGATIIRTAPELLLKSRYVIPKRLLDAGYVFAFPALGPALKDLNGGRRKK